MSSESITRVPWYVQEVALAEAWRCLEHKEDGSPLCQTEIQQLQGVLQKAGEYLGVLREKDNQLLLMHRDLNELRMENTALRDFVPNEAIAPRLPGDIVDDDAEIKFRQSFNSLSSISSLGYRAKSSSPTSTPSTARGMEPASHEHVRVRELEQQVETLQKEVSRLQGVIRRDERLWVRKDIVEGWLLGAVEREIEECELVEFMQRDLTQAREEIASLQRALVDLAAQYRVSSRHHNATLLKLKHIEEFFGAAFEACAGISARSPRGPHSGRCSTPPPNERQKEDVPCPPWHPRSSNVLPPRMLSPRPAVTIEAQLPVPFSDQLEVVQTPKLSCTPFPTHEHPGVVGWACDTALGLTLASSRIALRMASRMVPAFLAQRLPLTMVPPRSPTKPEIPRLRLEDALSTHRAF